MLEILILPRKEKRRNVANPKYVRKIMKVDNDYGKTKENRNFLHEKHAEKQTNEKWMIGWY